MQIQEITGGMLPTNCFIVTDEETGISAVIDPGFISDELFDKIKELKKQDYEIIDIISEAPVMCLVFVEADYLVAVTYNMFYDFDDVLSFSKFFVKEHFSTK